MPQDPNHVDIPGLFGGFSSAFHNDVMDERERQRKAEDTELENKSKLLAMAIDSMKTNPANAELVKQAYRDYVTAISAIGKGRPTKKTSYQGAFRGESDLPELGFLDKLIKGDVPMFGNADFEGGMAGVNGAGAPGAVPQPPTGPGAGLPETPQLPAQAQAGAGGASGAPMGGPKGTNWWDDKGVSEPLRSGWDPRQITLPPAPIPPTPTTHELPGPGTRLLQAGNDLAKESVTNPQPRLAYTPGMIMSPEGASSQVGFHDYMQRRYQQQALIDNMKSLGASDAEIRRALSPRGSYGSVSPFMGGNTFIAPDGHHFTGQIAKDGSGVYDVSTNPGQPFLVQGAVRAPQALHWSVSPDSTIQYTQPGYPDLGEPGYGATTYNTQVPVLPPPPVSTYDEGAGTNVLRGRGEAVGAEAPRPAERVPEVVERRAAEARDAAINEANKFDTTSRSYLYPPDERIRRIRQAEETYDRAIKYNRSEGGGRTQAEPKDYLAEHPEQAEALGAPKKGDTFDMRPWYKIFGKPPLVSGRGPNWNAPAKQRMMQYIDWVARTRGIQMTNDERLAKLDQAMRSPALRAYVGLRD